MQRVGSRAQVMHGNAKMKGGGLKKKDLKYNKQGKIVSKKISKMAKKEMRLQKAGWVTKKGQFGAVRSMNGGTRFKNMRGGDLRIKCNIYKKDRWNLVGLCASGNTLNIYNHDYSVNFVEFVLDKDIHIIKENGYALGGGILVEVSTKTDNETIALLKFAYPIDKIRFLEVYQGQGYTIERMVIRY
jgi:hypothetical protein